MFSDNKGGIEVLIVSVILLVTLLCTFIITIVYKYQQRQIRYLRDMEALKAQYENTLLQSQLEMQEQTFQHIAREIHDNIGQKLTLAKLYMNTHFYKNENDTRDMVSNSLALISESINSLSDISRSMSTEMILNNGLIKGIEAEVVNLQKAGVYEINFDITGQEIFLTGNAELVIFRIVQECINNFIKHAEGTSLSISLNYTAHQLVLNVNDNGKGFDTKLKSPGAGLSNILKRTTVLKGVCNILSTEKGSCITINIPIKENAEKTKPGTGG